MRSVIFLALVAAGLAATNPTKADYAAWAKIQIAKQGLLGGVVGALMPASVIEGATQRTNLLVLSVFDTQVADTSTRTVGVASTFFKLSSNDARR